MSAVRAVAPMTKKRSLHHCSGSKKPNSDRSCRRSCKRPRGRRIAKAKRGRCLDHPAPPQLLVPLQHPVHLHHQRPAVIQTKKAVKGNTRSNPRVLIQRGPRSKQQMLLIRLCVQPLWKSTTVGHCSI